MSGMGWLFETYIKAVMKAYGLTQGEAYVFAGRKSQGYIDGCIIRDPEAHDIAGDMDRAAKDLAIDFQHRLTGDV